ncbi:DHA2 family efflux MFS transporter permease subunit [Actinomadura kijaniata]|uniref:DHA2 family efflux MFS transporter permease subunit n=1 Tax=Actinomadura kijaniata TaxID=46161 RepID=UPI003F1B4FE8
MTKLRGNPWAVLLTLSLGFFMTLLDLTIVNIAVPSMIDKLGASLDQALWITSAYVLALAVLLITAGRLGDLWGKKNLFVAGVVVFTLASLACGLAQDPAQLIAARAVQGVGAALLMPQTMSIIIETFPPQRRGAALGVWGAVAGVSAIAGPTIGGVLVTSLDWRWIFLVNLPIGIAVVALAFPILPGRTRTVRHRFDLTGVLLASAALLCLTFALTEGQKYDWAGWIWGLLGLSAVLLAVFVLHQRGKQDREPLVPFALFRDRNFAILNFVAATVSVGMVGVFLPMTIYLQSVLGYSALEAGLVMAPSSVMSMLLAPVSGRLADRIGGRFLLMGGLLLYVAGNAWFLAAAGPGASWPALLPGMIVSGIGVGCVFAPMGTEATRNVPPHLAGAASGVNNTMRQVGSVLGGAVTGAVLQHQLASALRTEAAERAAALPPQAREGFVDGFSNAAKGGLEVGASHHGATPPPGTSPGVAHQVQDLAAQVFTHGFVDAMKPTIWVALAVVLCGAAACLGVRAYRGAPRRDSVPDQAMAR